MGWWRLLLAGLVAATMAPVGGRAGAGEKPDEPVEFCGQRLSREVGLVDCSSREVSDLRPLEKLPRLSYLYLTGTSVRDLTPLSRLPQLEYLVIDAGIDASPLTGRVGLTVRFRPRHLGRIAGRVEDAQGKALRRVRLEINRTDTDCFTVLAVRRSSSDGAFVFDGLMFGRYLLSLSATSSSRFDPVGDDGSDGWKIRAVKEWRVGALQWDGAHLWLSDAKKVSGLVRDAGGAALPGARVTVSFRARPRCAPAIPFGQGREVGSAWFGRMGTGPDGRFVLQTQVVGGMDDRRRNPWDVFTIEVSVWAPGHARLKLEREVVGPLKTGLDLGELRLKSAP